MNQTVKPTRKLLFGKTLLIALVSTIVVTVLLVYVTGLATHRSLLENFLISVTTIALFLFLFMAFGLYNGLNVLDNYSHKLQLTWKQAHKRMPDAFVPDMGSDVTIPDVGDGIGGIVAGIILWVVFSIVLVTLLVVLQAVVWLAIVLLLIAIYWVMIRSLKLIFSKSAECEGDLAKSVVYAFGYTALYVGWIYGISYLATLF